MHEQICEWLGLPAENWPPDHYTLLGLQRGESDPQVIEQRVHQRMQRVRPLQLIYPDQVTEAMNRLAQAFSCLTDPAARSAYDDSLRVPPRRPANRAPSEGNGSVDPDGPLAWLFGPWDRLAEEEILSPSLVKRPNFRNWSESQAPPRQRRKRLSRHTKDRVPDQPASGNSTDAMKEPRPRSALFWRHSNTVLLILAILALLVAFGRQLGR
jgi:hypothetical protein